MGRAGSLATVVLCAIFMVLQFAIAETTYYYGGGLGEGAGQKKEVFIYDNFVSTEKNQGQLKGTIFVMLPLEFQVASPSKGMLLQLKKDPAGDSAELRKYRGLLQATIETAIIEEKNDLIRILYQMGADLNARHSYFGDTYLIEALDNGKLNSARTLIELGADVNLKTKKRSAGDYEYRFEAAPLYWATKLGNMELINILVSHGAKIQDNILEQSYERSYADIAAVEGHLEVLKYFLNHKVSLQQNSFTAVARKGHCEILEYLVKDKGVNVETTETTGRNALCEAVMQNKIDSVKCLLRLGANVNWEGQHGETPLEFAIGYGASIEILEILIHDGAKLDHKNKWGQTPLFIAKRKNRQDIIKYLLDKGAKDWGAQSK